MGRSIKVSALSLVAAAVWIGSEPGRVEWAGPVHAAQSMPVLVELFTSEGCSSCPPADRLLRELDARQDVSGAHVLVLEEHVDYWDHLGWRDSFSSPTWTARQQHYADLLHKSEVFTPQAVVDGTRDAVGSDASTLRARIAAAARVEKQPLAVTGAEWQGGDLVVTVDGGPYPGSTLVAVIADEHDSSRVDAGENQGRALEHVAVARALAIFKHGEHTLRVSTPYKSSAGRAGHVRVIVFAQAPDGRVLAAAERPA